MYNIPCRYNETSDAGVNVTINATMIGFVTLSVKDQQTQELYSEYFVGITRPPPQIQDKVRLLLLASRGL